MQNEIVINADAGETRVAILERSTFTELYIERDNDRSVVGNVIKGRVGRVLPGMQAAFVDIGLEKAGFLYVGDYFPVLEANKSSNSDTSNGRRKRYGRGRTPPKIETVLREGQDVVIQIAKEPIGTKGARITSNISIPGRHLVLTPGSNRVGVSRRIDSDKERRRLREIVERLRVDDLGFIIRTAGHGVRESDLEADIKYLTTVWNKIKSKMETHSSPSVLYSELELPLKMIRDFANAETSRISIDSKPVYEELKTFVDDFVAAPKPKIVHYTEPTPIFDDFSLESKISENLERKVMLKNGGHLVFDQGEALTAIDVNTGRFTGKRDLEETILRTNLEAVREVVYQLRFRNIGGLIIIDLIDMETADHREKVYRALQEALRTDKARTNILKISELGLVEMTRKRTRENLLQVLCESCSYCEGRGFVLSRKSVAFKVLREVRNDLPRFSSRRIAISVNPLVAEQLLRDGQKGVVQLGEELGREIEVRARPGIHQEQFEVTALDAGPPVSIPLRWLDGTRPSAEVEDGENKRPRRGRGRRGGGRGAAAENAEGQEDENTQGAAEMTEAAEASASEATESPKGISEESAAVESPTETSEPKTPVVAAEAASTPEPESETPRGAATGTKSVRTPARRTSASLIATMSSLDDDDVPEEQPESPLEAEPVELNPEIKPEASRASGGAAAAEVPEEFESPAIETPEVLDGEPEMRILPGSRKPEES
jgi:ribonuclease G